MPPASNNVCVTADLNASTDNSFSAMNCLLADGYSPVTQGDPRRPASPQSPSAGMGARGVPAVAGAPPRCPQPLAKPCGVPGSQPRGRGLGSPPDRPRNPALPRAWRRAPMPRPGPCPALGQGPVPAAPSSSERPRGRRRGDAGVHVLTNGAAFRAFRDIYV